MSRATVQFNDYVSLAIMLLMLVALLGGQTGSTAYADNLENERSVLVEVDNKHLLSIDFDGQFGDNEVSIKFVADKDLSHFRGEDE